jgi:hypothetical protein
MIAPTAKTLHTPLIPTCADELQYPSPSTDNIASMREPRREAQGSYRFPQLSRGRLYVAVMFDLCEIRCL